MRLSVVIGFRGQEVHQLEFGEALLANADALEAMAGAAGLNGLEAYADRRTVPEGFDGDPEDLAEVMGEFEAWFDSGVAAKL